MPVDDRDVLEFIGRQGKRLEQIEERFPGFDVLRLIRAGLVEIMRIPLEETQDPSQPPAPAFQDWYVLTPRGAESVGIDPPTLHAAQKAGARPVVEDEFEENVIDVGRLLRIGRKRKEEGDEALTAEERRYLEHCRKVMAVIGERMRKSLEGREAITKLGQEIYDLLPSDLQGRWANLTPAELTMLAMAFPEELPADARSLLGE